MATLQNENLTIASGLSIPWRLGQPAAHFRLDGSAPPHPSQRLLATAYHEAGHAVVADELGVGVWAVTIRPDLETNGHVRLAEDEILPRGVQPPEVWRRRVTREIAVKMAGFAAHRRVDPASAGHGASGDRANARELAALLEDDEHEQRRVLEQTAEFVEELVGRPLVWRKIRAVAGALLVDSEGFLTAGTAQRVIANATPRWAL